MKAWLPFFYALSVSFCTVYSFGSEFHLKEAREVTYEITDSNPKVKSETAIVRGHRKGSTNVIEFYSKLFLQVREKQDLAIAVNKSGLPEAKRLNGTSTLLNAPDAMTAIRVCAQLAQLPYVKSAHPITRRQKILFSSYAPAPKDPYFQFQWHLEDRDTNGTPRGTDIDARSAWAVSKGEGVIVGIADDGVEITHPELVTAATDSPHFNYADKTTDAGPSSSFDRHGTAVAGLIAAEGDNNVGITGVAPHAKIANWKIFDFGSFVMNDDDLFNLYQFHSDIVGVQNHSWGEASVSLAPSSSLEKMGIENAVTLGRGGKGVVIVRAAGNGRLNGGDANFDESPSNPYVIAVGAVKESGEFASYSSPGACILVAGPGGDTASATLFTTDRQGTEGYNFANYTNDFANYAFEGSGFVGTSGSSPIVAGIAALVLSANTNLTYRDVQQIILLSARHVDLRDSDMSTNAAGLRVSHNVGYGVPDAGVAVRLAKKWVNRPAATNLVFTTNVSSPIPDDGLRVRLIGGPEAISNLGATPSLGIPIDKSSMILPLVDIGRGAIITNSVAGKAALIQRGDISFKEKIDNAASAGASLVIVYNSSGGTDRVNMGQTEHTAIPSVFISQQDGEGLQQFLATNGTASVQLQINSAVTSIQVTNTLICEHVSVRIKSDHHTNSQLRITLTSPQGTCSVLQRLSFNPDPLEDWTYYSTHHFFESSAGVWTVAVTDEMPGGTGTVSEVELKLEGVAITDADGNGLDDEWELTNLGSIGNNPAADPDKDGYSNAIEQILQTQPLQFDAPLRLDFSRWNKDYS
ncbi:MAG: Peptidase and in kexin sedolisin, partial [Verrucomicrobiales bacterium]|nr:Peptidase and in kexin sedolisin [Verrucomicrobiales bacterium]